jgi:hypothetical protein
VTTARDPSSTVEMFEMQELIQRGLVIAPRYFSVGSCIGPSYGYPVGSLKQAEDEVFKRAELGALSIKQYRQMTRLQQQWVLMGCRKYRVNMTNEIEHYYTGIIGQIKNGTPQIEHLVRTDLTNAYKDFQFLAAMSGTTFTATVRVNTAGVEYYRTCYPEQTQKMRTFNPRLFDSFSDTLFSNNDSTSMVKFSKLGAAISKLGGGITMGSHGDDAGIGAHHELWALKLGGLTNMEVLKAATVLGAKALGLEKDLGSIVPGKIADLLILEKNPLDDIHNSNSIQFVIKDGVIYDANTLNQVWPSAS